MKRSLAIAALLLASTPALPVHSHELDDHEAVVYLFDSSLEGGIDVLYLCEADHKEGDRFGDVVCYND